MYTTKNFKSKAALKRAVAAGEQLTIYAPGLGSPVINGWESVEGPHYPKPHRWYGSVRMEDGIIMEVC